MQWKFRQFIAAATLAILPLAGVAANELQLVAATQDSPGKVVVTVSASGDSSPTTGNLSLQAGSASVRPRAVVAAASALPSRMVICIDRSGSIGAGPLDAVKTALKNALIDQGPQRLPFDAAVVSFGTRSTHVLNFTNQTALVTAAIDSVRLDNERAGRTLLFDAVAGAMATLRAPGDGRHHVVVISDGKDEGSGIPASRLVELAAAAPAVVIDTVSLGSMAASYSGVLSTLAGATGGRSIDAANAGELEPAFRTLVATIKPGRNYSAEFAYAASTDRGAAVPASLVYTGGNGGGQQLPLNISVAAPGDPAPAPPSPDKPRAWFDKVFDKLIDIGIKVELKSIFVWPAASALVAALALLVYRHYHPPENTVAETKEGAVISVHKFEVVPDKPQRRATSVGYTWAAPKPGAPTAVLQGISGTVRGQKVSIDKTPWRIGSEPDNDLVLVGDNFASGYHAILRFESGILYVEDIGSTNGSRHNGAAFKSASRPLMPGDELYFGHSQFTVRAGGTPKAPHGPGLEARVR